MNQKHYSQDLNKIVDSHCHLDFKDFDSDRDKIVNNAKLTNVDYLLTISVNLEDFEKVHEVTQNYENIWCTTGIHPNNVSSEPDTIQLDDIQNRISENLKNKNDSSGDPKQFFWRLLKEKFSPPAWRCKKWQRAMHRRFCTATCQKVSELSS